MHLRWQPFHIDQWAAPAVRHIFGKKMEGGLILRFTVTSPALHPRAGCQEPRSRLPQGTDLMFVNPCH